LTPSGNITKKDPTGSSLLQQFNMKKNSGVSSPEFFPLT
jgi:hypothetical protein